MTPLTRSFRKLRRANEERHEFRAEGREEIDGSSRLNECPNGSEVEQLTEILDYVLVWKVNIKLTKSIRNGVLIWLRFPSPKFLFSTLIALFPLTFCKSMHITCVNFLSLSAWLTCMFADLFHNLWFSGGCGQTAIHN